MTTKKVPAVEAKDGKPAEPEKVQASHILVKTGRVQDVPKTADVVKYLENAGKREFMQKFVKDQVDAADLQASERFARFLPQKSPDAAPVEKPSEK